MGSTQDSGEEAEPKLPGPEPRDCPQPSADLDSQGTESFLLPVLCPRNIAAPASKALGLPPPRTSAAPSASGMGGSISLCTPSWACQGDQALRVEPSDGPKMTHAGASPPLMPPPTCWVLSIRHTGQRAVPPGTALRPIPPRHSFHSPGTNTPSHSVAVQSSLLRYLSQHLLEETEIPSPLRLSPNASSETLWAQERSVLGLLSSQKQGQGVHQP